MKKTVAVIGAGIAGITVAYYLVKAGYEVTVYDEEPHPAMKTSYANGGQVSVSNSEVWTTWGNVWKGMKWMLKKDAPLLINPNLDLDKAIWLAKFLWHTANNSYAKNTAATIHLGLEARRRYRNIIAKEDLQFDQTGSGILHFYKDEKYFDKAIEAQEIYQKNNCEWTMFTEAQVLKKEPKLQGVNGIIGGAWTKDDWTGDIHKFCMALAHNLETKYGVKFYFNSKIEGLLNLAHYDKIVVASGVGSVKLARSIGDSLPIYPVKGYSITINNVDPIHLPKTSLLDDQAKIVTATLGNRFRVAGTAELAGENYDIKHDRIKPLLNWVHTNFPDINTHDYSSWACLRPMTPNMMPIVRQSKRYAKVYYHTGHGHLGWTLAPATALQLTKLMAD